MTLLIAALGIPVAGSALYLLTLAVASAFYRPHPDPPPKGVGKTGSRLVVLVPAHNEEELVGRTVNSLNRQTYPRALYRIVVVADNCTDRTAAVARAAGAEVLVRNQPSQRGKGHALAWAIERVFSEALIPEAIVVVDADAITDPDFLAELEAEFSAGHELVQANDLILDEPGSSRASLEAAALLLRNGVRFAGRAVLGLPATLCGNGMLLSRRVLAHHPWAAFTATEDSEYAISLRMAGVRTAFAKNARVYAAATSGEAGAHTQGVRWEAGRFHLMRLWLPRMVATAVARRRWDLLADALDVSVPPFWILTMLALAGLSVSLLLMLAGTVATLAVIPWAVAAVLLPSYVVVGLRAAGSPASYYRALLVLAPRFAVRKLKIYARLLKGFEVTQWVRTSRPAESQQIR
jgi:cellulose synthase/poly-beta-1,6-N-acetylglucosamine synthase-like glycosyltransferase